MVNEDYMRLALELAAEALADDEVPVGCVIIRKGELVGKGRNRREKQKMLWHTLKSRQLTRPA